MKRIPEQFHLNEDDIKEAIIEWLNENHLSDSSYVDDFDITFKTDIVAGPIPPGAPVGGMADYTKQIITATAVRSE